MTWRRGGSVPLPDRLYHALCHDTRWALMLGTVHRQRAAGGSRFGDEWFLRYGSIAEEVRMVPGDERARPGAEDLERPTADVRRATSPDVELEIEALGPFNEASERAAAEARGAGTAIAVLVVDDDPDLRRYVRRALRHMETPIGQVVEAGDGAEAMARIGEGQVTLVISDVLMPVMDGYALTRAIRDLKTANELPVLLITGEGSPRETADRAREVGAQGVLWKPFNAHKLCEAVEAVLDGRKPTGGRQDR